MEIREILLKMGISANLKGYHYILEAVEIIRKQTEKNNILVIYQQVCEKRKSKSAQSVERAIRHSIEVSWNKQTMIRKIYSKKPVNSALLYDLVYNFDIFESQI